MQIASPRNNHHGGVFRVCSVPCPKMQSKAAHRKFIILHSCFDRCEYDCKPVGDECGTDRGHVAFRRTIEISTCLVDGVYVFANVWYGGSCKPVFEAGQGKKVLDGKCQTPATNIGECTLGCPNTSSFYTSRRFTCARGFPEKDVEKAFKSRSSAVNEISGSCEGNVCCLKSCGGCGGPNCKSNERRWRQLLFQRDPKSEQTIQ